MPFDRRVVPMKSELKEKVESSAKNIFEIFFSLSVTPPPGAYRLWTGEWINECASLYPTFWSKALEYRSSGAIRVVDNTTYENELTRYGETGAFVISGNNIRLPKITRYLRSIDSTANIGVPLPAGLPNITGTFGGVSRRAGNRITPTGAFTSLRERFNWGPAGSEASYANEIEFDASKSNSAYGSANTVQMDSVQVALYIQVYHGTTELSNAQMNSLINQVASLSNQVTQLTQQLEAIKNSNFGAPNHAGRVNLTPEASATTISYTATSNGYICGFYMRQNDGGTQIDLTIDGVTYTNWSRPGSYYVNGHMSVCMPVKKGSVIVITRTSGNWNNKLNWTYFVPTE